MTEEVLTWVKVLVLDDKRTALEDLETQLSSLGPGTTIFTEQSLSKGLAMVEEAELAGSPYDFLVMDLEFDDSLEKKGLDAIAELTRTYPRLKTIAVTGKDSDAGSVLEAGAFAFFLKPLYTGLTDTIRLASKLEGLAETLDRSQHEKSVFREMLNNLDAGISVVDRRMRTLYVNRLQREMSGLGDGLDPIGHMCYEVFATGATDVCPDCPVIQLFHNPGLAAMTATHLRGPEGKRHTITALPLRSGGEVVAAIKMAYDVTSREEFENFRRGLHGRLRLDQRMLEVLQAVGSRGYKRVRILLFTDDGKFVEAYRMRDGEGGLGNFQGRLESLENPAAKGLRKVRETLKPQVFDESGITPLPCWQETELPDGLGVHQYGLVPMLGDRGAIGALYVDNFEAKSADGDVDRTPTEITPHGLQELIGFASEGARAILASKEMEEARQGINHLKMDMELMEQLQLEDGDETRLLDTLLRNAVEVVQQQRRRKILRDEPLEIRGEVYLVEGVWLVRKSCDELAPLGAPHCWHLEKDPAAFPVKILQRPETEKGETEVYSHDLFADREWLDWVASRQGSQVFNSEYWEFLETQRSYSCWPLTARGKRRGVLILFSPSPNVFDDLTRDVLQARVNRTNVAFAAHLRTAQINRLVEMYSTMSESKSLADEKDFEQTIFAFLTGLTHKKGLAFNRAVYLEREADLLVETGFAVGPPNRDEGAKLYAGFHRDGTPSMKETLAKGPRSNPKRYGIPSIPVMTLGNGVTVLRRDDPSLVDPIIFDRLQTKTLYLLPIRDGNDLIAAVLLDNSLTGKEPTPEKLSVMASVAADYSTLFRQHRSIQKLEKQTNKDKLMYALSHSLKSDILGPYEVIRLALESDDGLLKEMLPAIAEKLRNLHMVTSDLLRFSLVQSGDLKAHAKFVDAELGELVRAVVDTYGTGRLQTVDFNIGSNKHVRCDLNLLRHVIVNVLDNAWNYSPKTSTIDVRIHDWDNDASYLGISVVNEPIEPIGDEDPGPWFGLFQRGQHGRFAEGTGIGLYIAAEIMSIHNGDIKASVQPDGRVAVFVIIPVSESQGKE